jgi:hypothetical protein
MSFDSEINDEEFKDALDFMSNSMIPSGSNE